MRLRGPIYLAGRYGRRAELAEHASQLRSCGFAVRADWLTGTHETLDGMVTDVGQAEWAKIDLRDIVACRTLIAFTEEPRSTHGRGGRHVEFGIAIGLGLDIFIVGPRENVFCWLHEVNHYDTWDDLLRGSV